MKKLRPRCKPRKWTQDKVQFLKDNYKTLSYRELSDKLGLTYAAISDKAHRLGLDSRNLWRLEEDKIIRDNYSCNPEVWDLLPNRSRCAITMRARKLGFKRECGNASINFKFFEEWNKDSAYVLGFFMADGCVEPHFNRISCELSMKDYDHLVNIRNLIGSTNPICKKKTRYSCSLAIHNKKMVNDVVSKGMIPRKTTRVRLPYMPDEVFKDFLRGYIDGDGSIWYERNNYIRMSILGNRGYIQDIANKIYSFYGVEGSITERNKHLNTGNCYGMKFSGKKAKVILNDIYYDNCFTLMRKKVLARGVTPRKIYSTQISQASSSGTREPEGKTELCSDPAETVLSNDKTIRGAPLN